MLVMKFGGTSVGDADRIMAAADIAVKQDEPLAIITSAMSGVTDLLLELAEAAQARQTAEVEDILSALRRRHIETAEAVTPKDTAREKLLVTLGELFSELENLIRGIRLLQELSPRSLDLVASFGERLCAHILAAAIESSGRSCVAVDSREIICTDDTFGSANVMMELSADRTRGKLNPLITDSIVVITGFIGQTEDGLTTTLGRGGSDYSATLVGAFMEAREIWIWTDVDGVMTADPRVVPEARVLESVTYREAAEMAFFGSKVLHPSTMTPAVDAGIPIRVRNAWKPDFPGTLICESRFDEFEGVKTVTSIAGLALVTIEGRGMQGVPGVVSRAFSAIARGKINILMISQGSSEHNISFVIRRARGPEAISLLENEFELELQRNRIDRIDIMNSVGILAIIGEGMKGTPGISQRLFSALGRGRINVLAIAQGSSELNVSVVVEESDLKRAVGAVHSRFGLTKTIHVFLLGKGLIGRTLLSQLMESRGRLEKQHGTSLRVIGVCDTKYWVFDEQGLGDERLAKIAEGKSLQEIGGEPRPEDDAMISHIAKTKRLDVVLADVTAGETGGLHRKALSAGLHVVAANKKPLSGSLEEYDQIRSLEKDQGLSYHFETTFGAGLPVLFTLQDLLQTHDEIRSIRGCFSGTLGFICSGLEDGRPFSELVMEAKQLGYTEPDPRDDLGGVDVARKALIIAREIGARIEMKDVALRAMASEELMALPDVESFLSRLPEMDAEMKQKCEDAANEGKVLRYVAEITPDTVSVGLKAVDSQSPLGQLKGPDNILVYETDRYQSYPLVIRGPGAGAAVTAAGVFGDILKVARRT